MSYEFPQDFIFGAATASYQIEGAVNEDGRGESIWDRFSHTPGKTRDGDTGDVSCDHYHRLDEDIGLMVDLGLSAYRFSVAWPRIVPDGDGAANQRGLDFYSLLVDKLLAAGITPYATLYHWDLPQSLEDRFGGWRSRKTAEAFGRYAEIVVKRLGDRVVNWMPLNEMPATIVAGYQEGFHAPGAKEPPRVINQIQHNLLLAHGYGVRAVRKHCPAGEVGTAHNARVYVPTFETDEHIASTVAAFMDHNGPMLEPLTWGRYPEKWLAAIGSDAPQVAAGDMELISTPCDFIGLNVYRGIYVRPSRQQSAGDTSGAGPVENVSLGMTATPTTADLLRGNYELVPFPPSYPRGHAEWVLFVPQAVYWGTRILHQQYGYQKVYITENGTVGKDDLTAQGEILDLDRLQYYRLYLQSAQRAAAEGIPLKGYFAWSLMDNFEWSEGYYHRFGLHYVDYKTLKRTPKLSAQFYAACIKNRRVV